MGKKKKEIVRKKKINRVTAVDLVNKFFSFLPGGVDSVEKKKG